MTDEANTDTKLLEPIKGTCPSTCKSWRDDFFIAAFLALMVFMLYATPVLLGRPFSDQSLTEGERSGASIAVAAREMIFFDDYLVPFNSARDGDDGKSLTKSPLPYWVVAYVAKGLAPALTDQQRAEGSQRAPSNFVMKRAVQLSSALAMALSVFLATFYASIIFSRVAGLWTGILLGCSVMVCTHAFWGSGEAILLLTTTLSICATAWIVTATQPGILSALVLGCGLGLTLLAQGLLPVAMLLIVVPVLLEILIRRSFNIRKVGLFIFGLLIAAGVALPWFYTVEQNYPGSFRSLLNEMSGALNLGAGHMKCSCMRDYLEKLVFGLMPWTPLLLVGWLFWWTRGREASKIADQLSWATDGMDAQAVSQAQNEAQQRHDNLRFMMVTGVLGFIGFYFLPQPQSYHLLLLPPLLMASGGILGQYRFPGGRAEEALAWCHLLFGWVLSLAVATLPAWLPFVAEWQSADVHEALLDFLNTVGWVVTLPIGLAILLLHFALARQWVEGKIVTAALISGAAAYAGMFAWAVH